MFELSHIPAELVNGDDPPSNESGLNILLSVRVAFTSAVPSTTLALFLILTLSPAFTEPDSYPAPFIKRNWLVDIVSVPVSGRVNVLLLPTSLIIIWPIRDSTCEVAFCVIVKPILVLSLHVVKLSITLLLTVLLPPDDPMLPKGTFTISLLLVWAKMKGGLVVWGTTLAVIPPDVLIFKDDADISSFKLLSPNLIVLLDTSANLVVEDEIW